MNDKEITCCFTGPRPPRLPSCGNEASPEICELKERLFAAVKAAYAEGYRNFISGMAEGFDLFAAEAVIRLKKLYPDAELFAAFPCEASPKNHSAAICKRIQDIMAEVSSCYFVCEKHIYGCELSRNVYMVENSSMVIGYYDGFSKGTAHCWHCGEQRGLKLINLCESE